MIDRIMMPDAMRSPRSPKIWFSPVQLHLLLLTVSLVAATTYALLALQNALLAREQDIPLRPFSIGYLVPLFVVTTLGGRRLGRLALGLCALLTVFVLAPPDYTMAWLRPRDWAELALLLVVGEIMVRGVDSIRRDMALREDVEQSPFTASLIAQAKDAACGVAGVEGVGQCALRRRGMEYFLEMDVLVRGTASLRDADAVASHVSEAVQGVYHLIGGVRVRLRPVD